MLFGDLLNRLVEHQVILVGVTQVEMPADEIKRKPAEELIINPRRDYPLRAGDNILVVAFS